MSNTKTQFNEKRLFKILSTNRAHGGPGISVVEAMLREAGAIQLIDSKGAVAAWVASTDVESRTLFVAHVDTAEQWDGVLTRPVYLDDNTQTLIGDGKHVLGADDGAGVALLLHMIENEVPGTYLFTQGEEKGGIGAKVVSNEHADFLRQYDRAISFDRRGTGSVITHMFNGRTCSDEFAEALSSALDTEKYPSFPDSTGSYTDTAEFTNHIGECTNVSIGYMNEHGPRETLDMNYLRHLAQHVLTVQWGELPTKRQAGEQDPDYELWGGYRASTGARRATSVESYEDLFEMSITEIAKWISGAEPMDAALVISDMLDAFSYMEAGFSLPDAGSMGAGEHDEGDFYN